MALSSKQLKFVASYQITQDQTIAARNAGYSDKSASKIGWQLMQNKRIIAELDKWKASKREEITKEDFVDLALKDYKSLEVTEANKPRFLDLAGKAMGYLNNNGDSRPNQTLNITINTETELNSKNMGEIWENTRKLLGS